MNLLTSASRLFLRFKWIWKRLRYHPLSTYHLEWIVAKSRFDYLENGMFLDQNIPLDKQIGNMRIDMILIDETGVQLHATVSKRHAQSLSPLLQEGRVLHIENFSVTSVLNDYRLLKQVESEAKVNLWGNTVNLIDKDVIETATSGPVLVVTSLIIREFFDEYHFSSTNSTQLLFNLEIPEVRSIMNSSDDGKVELLIGSSSTQSNVEERS
ncbi:hypothetical protein IFM89_020086 [Coptis chinensis]|uniref:Replication protein A 70 kDa DNA-binding subunit B/D first OB fold domain-containing protein n=1 Tax=Coptis chinensis TaxID=261450 RepID=A0A835LM60_9MAGN|nr:hypothetical protein IFM89_020086 [Coptis chinensis]